MVTINRGVSGMLTIEEKKKCKAEYNKKYRQKNKEAIAEYKKKYDQKNKERKAEYKKEWYQKNKEAIAKYAREWYQKNKEHMKEASAEYYQKNKERIAEYNKEYNKEYRQKNKERLAEYKKEYNKEYRQNNKEAIAEYNKEYRENKYSTNLDYKFRILLRNALYKNLKRYLIKETNPEFSYTETSSSLLGCTVEELKTYIENQFEDGMTWENWRHDGWHLDHIIPCSSFDLTKKKEQKKCFHYTNLQPLWAEDNFSKSNKLNWSKKELVACLS